MSDDNGRDPSIFAPETLPGARPAPQPAGPPDGDPTIFNPVGHFLSEAARKGDSFDTVRPVLERNGLSPQAGQTQFKLAEARSRAAGMDEPAWLEAVRKSIPGSSAVGSFLLEREYGQASKRIAQGQAEDKDYNFVAQFERIKQLDAEKQQGFLGLIREAAFRAPAILGEAAATGGVSLEARAGAGAIEQAAKFAGTQALRTPLQPSLYLPQTQERANEQGGAPTDLKNLAPPLAMAYLQNLVLGSTAKIGGGKAFAQSLPSAPGRIAGAGVAGVGEQAAADVAGGLWDEVAKDGYKTKTRYGTVGDLARGDLGRASQHAASQALTFAAFAALHAGDAEAGKPVLEAYAEAQNELARKGLTQDAAASVTQAAVQSVAEKLKDPTATKTEIKELADLLPDGPPKKFATAFADALPDGWKATPAEPPPPAQGMVRMYHGGVPGEGPRWVTPDRAYAEGYAEKAGGGKTVQYVDIPEDSPLLTKVFDDTGTNMKSPFSAFEAPAEITKHFKPLPPKAAEVASVDTTRGNPPESAPPSPQVEPPAPVEGARQPEGPTDPISVLGEDAIRALARRYGVPAAKGLKLATVLNGVEDHPAAGPVLKSRVAEALAARRPAESPESVIKGPEAGPVAEPSEGPSKPEIGAPERPGEAAAAIREQAKAEGVSDAELAGKVQAELERRGASSEGLFRVPDYKASGEGVSAAIKELVNPFAGKWAAKGAEAADAHFRPGKVQFEFDPHTFAAGEVQDSGKEALLGSPKPMYEHPALKAIRFKGKPTDENFVRLQGLVADANQFRQSHGIEPIRLEATEGPKLEAPPPKPTAAQRFIARGAANAAKPPEKVPPQSRIEPGKPGPVAPLSLGEEAIMRLAEGPGPREQAALLGTLKGKSLREIAPEAGVSHETVNKDLAAISEELGVKPDDLRANAAADAFDLIEQNRAMSAAERAQVDPEAAKKEAARRTKAEDHVLKSWRLIDGVSKLIDKELANAEREGRPVDQALIDEYARRIAGHEAVARRAEAAKQRDQAANRKGPEPAGGVPAKPAAAFVSEHAPQWFRKQANLIPNGPGKSFALTVLRAGGIDPAKSDYDLHDIPKALIRKGGRSLDELAPELKDHFGGDTPEQLLEHLRAKREDFLSPEHRAALEAEANREPTPGEQAHHEDQQAEEAKREAAANRNGDVFGITEDDLAGPWDQPAAEQRTQAPGKPIRLTDEPGSVGGVPGLPGNPNVARVATDPREFALARMKAEQGREQVGLPKMGAAERFGNPQAWAEAELRLARDPEAGQKLVTELEAHPRPITSSDGALLLHRRIAVANAYENAVRFANGKATVLPADSPELVGLRRRVEDLKAEWNRTDQVVKAVGSQLGRGLAFYRQLAREDYSLAGMLATAEFHKGRPLTEPETAAVTRVHEEIKRADEKQAAVAANPAAAAPKGQVGDALDVSIAAKTAKTKYADLVAKLRFDALPWHQKAAGHSLEVSNAVRTFLTAYDLSAVLRQGAVLSYAHPIKAARAVPDMLRGFLSERDFQRSEATLRQRPNAALYERSGLYLADKDSLMSHREEAFLGKWVDKIPGVKASERAYVGFLNRLRADVFDSMTGTLSRGGRPTDAEAKAVANFVNVATGRGHLGPFEKAATGLAHVFFSPRYLASRLQFMAGQPFYQGSAATRKLIAQEYARSALGLAVFYGVATALNDDAKLSFDPRSSDFGKVRFGNTRIDPLAGFGQLAVFGARLVSGETTSSTSGKTTALRGPDVKRGDTTTGDVVLRFLRSKLAPVPGVVMDALTGETPVGEPVTAESTAKQMLLPISVKDVQEAFQDQDVPRGAALALLAILGMSTQSYEKRKPGPKPEPLLPVFPREDLTRRLVGAR